jgi:hypothetical protein
LGHWAESRRKVEQLIVLSQAYGDKLSEISGIEVLEFKIFVLGTILKHENYTESHVNTLKIIMTVMV